MDKRKTLTSPELQVAPVVVFPDGELRVGGKCVRSAVSGVLPVCVPVDQPVPVLGSPGVLTSCLLLCVFTWWLSGHICVPGTHVLREPLKGVRGLWML